MVPSRRAVNRILLFGNTGQLGWELDRCLAPLGEVTALDLPQIDLARPAMVREVIRARHPDLIINATAYTAVDKAESEPDLARRINAEAPGIMAEESRRIGAAFIHYSTDYVFNGQACRPYTEADSLDPLSVYGATKLEGEEVVRQVAGSYLILRTSWVYSLRRRSFVTQVMEWARTRQVLRVATDQVGSPTWCRMLAEATAHLIARLEGAPVDALREHSGVFHLAGSGAASRYEWARLILNLDPHREEHTLRELQPALASEFPSSARRPGYSALNCDLFHSTFGLRLPDWRQALRLAMSDDQWRGSSLQPAAWTRESSDDGPDENPRALRPALFLDRDGVIIENREDYLRAWDQAAIIPGVLSALARARSSPYAIVIITNQSAIGRGLIDRSTADEINARLVAAIQDAGGRVDGVFMCPHAPEAGCDCRKPQPGLVLQAARALSVDLARSVLVGDALSDILAARAAGVPQAILVRTGRGNEQLSLAGDAALADICIYDNLPQALDAILGHECQ